MSKQRTFVMVKPDGLQRGLVGEIISRFCEFRKKHLVNRFKRLAKIEMEKIERNSELIRFIKEGWNTKVTKIKNKADFEKKLKSKKLPVWSIGSPCLVKHFRHHRQGTKWPLPQL